MKSHYMQMQLFLAVTEHSEVEIRLRRVPRFSPVFWTLAKRCDDLSQEIESIYRKTEVRS